MRITLYFIITFLFACQHNPSNVQIVYKNSKGVGYQPSGFKLLDEEDYTPRTTKSTEDVMPPRKKPTLELTPLEATEDVVETTPNKSVSNSEKMTSSEKRNDSYHVVQKGETYYSVARLYFLDPKNLMQWNGAKEGEKLHPATIIRLYGEGENNVARADLPTITSAKTSGTTSGAKPLQVSSASKHEAAVPSAKNLEIRKDPSAKSSPPNPTRQQPQPEAKQVASSSKPAKCGESFILPVSGLKIETKFGDTYKSGVKSDGIIFEANVAQNIKAASSGEVAYVGDGFSDYGNIVIIRHNNSYFSIYGHLANTSVKRGQVVKNGEVIASTNPIERKFYFSIRKGKTPVDPLSCIKK